MPSHLRRHDEPGHVHFWTISSFRRLDFFCDDGIRGVLIQGLRLLQSRHRICLIGYVLMPEHVHVLLLPHALGSDEPIAISRLLHTFKQHTGYYAKQRLREVWAAKKRLWSQPLNAWAQGIFGRERPIWNVRGYDFNVTTHDALLTKLDYCHKNPVTRGLVDRPDDWPWSSYRFHELQDARLLSMDWQGQWPIVW